MSRWLPWLSELQPELFCEVSPELAAERGLRNGEWATISTARAEIEARVLVTNRMQPLRMRKRTIHQIGLPYHWSSKGLVTGDTVNELISFVADPNVSIQESKALTADIRPGRGRDVNERSEFMAAATAREPDADGVRGAAPTPARVGFFTDTTVCIGCKACEVACKQWNQLPDDGLLFSGMSYDNTVHLGASTWRHVAFVERPMVENTKFSWLLMSDVCKHCRTAACLDACPTGSIIRTEFDTVFVQPDICNGCGYCVSACPFGVIDRREDDGRAWKCTLCYDRLDAGHDAGVREGVSDRVDPVR